MTVESRNLRLRNETRLLYELVTIFQLYSSLNESFFRHQIRRDKDDLFDERSKLSNRSIEG